MSLLSLFSRRSATTSAPVARDRLQILLAHERSAVGRNDLLSMLREEILAVISKHMSIDKDKVRIKMERGDARSVLEIEVEIPAAVAATAVAA